MDMGGGWGVGGKRVICTRDCVSPRTAVTEWWFLPFVRPISPAVVDIRAILSFPLASHGPLNPRRDVPIQYQSASLACWYTYRGCVHILAPRLKIASTRTGMTFCISTKRRRGEEKKTNCYRVYMCTYNGRLLWPSIILSTRSWIFITKLANFETPILFIQNIYLRDLYTYFALWLFRLDISILFVLINMQTSTICTGISLFVLFVSTLIILIF